MLRPKQMIYVMLTGGTAAIQCEHTLYGFEFIGGSMSEDMNMENGMEITEDDKLWAMLAYIFSPIVPIILMLMEDKKNRPFIKAHNMQALVLGLLSTVIAMVIGWLIVPLCLNLALFVYAIYLGLQAYQGKMVTIPVITDLVKNQGWA
jgi:uncharacterized membrane protein